MQFEKSKYILLLVCSIVIMFCRAEPIHVCGNGLNRMMAEICSEGFNYKLKRSDATLPNYNSIDPENNFGAYSNVDFAKQPLLYSMLGESARHQLVTTRRRRFSIVEECCTQACHRWKLREYCL